MRITLCVDALGPQPGGIGRYTWELCKGLARREDISSLQLFGRGRLVRPSSVLSSGAVPRRWSLSRLFGERTTRRLLRESIVHGPNYFLPPKAELGVVTVHDLSVFRHPETHPAERVQAFERTFQQSLERASHIITDTETVRRELTAMFSIPPEVITAVPLGVDPRFRPRRQAALAAVLESWGLAAGAYGLCVSTLEPRKRICELLGAWRRLPAKLRDRFPLVLAGGPGWQNERLRDEVKRCAAEGWLRHLGFVPEDLLPQLYSGAALFVYPSVYEGFGLPPIEAMASGVPVIVSDRSCLPEVCADAALYVDPDDEESFASVVRQGLTDDSWRSESVQRGLDRARTFTWNRCIEGTVGVYQRVATARKGSQRCPISSWA